MGVLVRLFPKREIGTSVARHLGAWAVFGLSGNLLSRHHTLEGACRMSRWHAGTRFVFVQGSDQCWDGELGRFVTWDVAAKTMGLP